jgi:pimeloyl-ACP methyl ester carboxylesterase
MTHKQQEITKRGKSAVGTGLGILTGMTLGLAGGWILYSKTAIDHDLPLPKAIPADLQPIDTESAGRLYYYADRKAQGRPLLLLHSINAAASAYEMWPLFEYYRDRRPVFALDLPGYGFSARTERDYNPYLFERAILEMMALEIGQPADVIALSLSCEFAVRAAVSEPERFHSLTLISPTGFSEPNQERLSQRAKRGGSMIHSALAFPLWDRPLFDLITSRPSIRYFLGQSFVGPVPEEMVDYSFLTAHQPGAQHAPLYFLSGQLFTPQVRTYYYEKSNRPTLVLYDQDAYTGFDHLPEMLTRKPNWQARRIAPTRGLPHFEQLGDTVAELEKFWAG